MSGTGWRSTGYSGCGNGVRYRTRLIDGAYLTTERVLRSSLARSSRSERRFEQFQRVSLSSCSFVAPGTYRYLSLPKREDNIASSRSAFDEPG